MKHIAPFTYNPLPKNHKMFKNPDHFVINVAPSNIHCYMHTTETIQQLPLLSTPRPKVICTDININSAVSPRIAMSEGEESPV